MRQDTTDRTPLICVGASVRALAASAISAGFRPYCFDYFNDVDLIRSVTVVGGQVMRIAGYDDDTLRLIEHIPPDVPLIYGGAVENAPEFLDSLAQTRPVWGATGKPLRRCRDPWAVQKFAKAQGFRPLACKRTKPATGDWIWKPFASGGGIDIDNPACGKPGYWQERVEGVGYSVSSISGWTFHLPVRQKTTPTTAEWCYRHGMEDDFWQRAFNPMILAAGMVRRLGLRGLVGLDFLVNEQGEVSLLEINPRYTASMELVELGCGTSVLPAHAAACRQEPNFFRWLEGHAPGVTVAAKRVLFADRPCSWNAEHEQIRAGVHDAIIRDVPTAGTTFAPGEPMCTLVVGGEEEAVVAQTLNDWEQAVLRSLAPQSPPRTERHED